MSGTSTGIKALKGHGEGRQRHGRCKERDIQKLRMGREGGAGGCQAQPRGPAGRQLGRSHWVCREGGQWLERRGAGRSQGQLLETWIRMYTCI